MNEADARINELRKLYTSPNSDIFLPKNAQNIYENLKKDIFIDPASHADVLRLKNSVESDYRQREHRILRGATRYLSKRKFQAFSPCRILLGECKRE